MKLNSSILAAAFVVAMGTSAGWAAPTATVLDWSTQGPGNDANTYGGGYGAGTPSGALWSGGDGDPTVHVPDGNLSGVYQSPFNNTILSETRSYFSVGATDGNGDGANSPMTLTFANAINSFKLLWGSIDDYNTITFFAGISQVFELTGSALIALAGIPGVNGPNFEQVALVNFTDLGSTQFGGVTSIVFKSTSAALEFALPVPLPAALPLFGSAIGGLGLLRFRRKRGTTSAVAA